MFFELFDYQIRSLQKGKKIAMYLVCCCDVLFIEPYASELKEENRTDAELGR